MSHVAPSWSWFSIPVSPCWDVVLDFMNQGHQTRSSSHNDSYKGTLSSFQWPSSPRNKQSPSAFYNFEKLRVTMRMQACSPNSITSNGLHIRDNIVEEISGAAPIADPGHLSFYNDPDTEELPVLLGDVLLGLLYESRICDQRRSSWVLKCAGLCLAQGSEKDTWRRVGVWEVDLPLYSRDEEVCTLEAIMSSETREVTLL
jgi:hypothetical protein